jgi:hypothetical protein
MVRAGTDSPQQLAEMIEPDILTMFCQFTAARRYRVSPCRGRRGSQSGMAARAICESRDDAWIDE